VKNAAGADERFCVFGGFVDIVPESCTLLAESAVNVKDITVPMTSHSASRCAR
jgi:F-type H+-transporting ATPase subunit epsilon